MPKIYKIPLVHVCNALLSSGIFPHILKTTKATPLHRKGNINVVKITYLHPFYQKRPKYWQTHSW
jgi:hypothetical protein